MKTKRILSAIIAGAMTAATFAGAVPSIAPSIGNISVSAEEQVKITSGHLGENASWELDDEGTITFSGSGKIDWGAARKYYREHYEIKDALTCFM